MLGLSVSYPSSHPGDEGDRTTGPERNIVLGYLILDGIDEMAERRPECEEGCHQTF